ncbi:hypothetical protein, partial [Plasmodium yoelii yoelii]
MSILTIYEFILCFITIAYYISLDNP